MLTASGMNMAVDLAQPPPWGSQQQQTKAGRRSRGGRLSSEGRQEKGKFSEQGNKRVEEMVVGNWPEEAATTTKAHAQAQEDGSAWTEVKKKRNPKEEAERRGGEREVWQVRGRGGGGRGGRGRGGGRGGRRDDLPPRYLGRGSLDGNRDEGGPPRGRHPRYQGRASNPSQKLEKRQEEVEEEEGGKVFAQKPKSPNSPPGFPVNPIHCAGADGLSPAEMFPPLQNGSNASPTARGHSPSSPFLTPSPPLLPSSSPLPDSFAPISPPLPAHIFSQPPPPLHYEPFISPQSQLASPPLPFHPSSHPFDTLLRPLGQQYASSPPSQIPANAITMQEIEEDLMRMQRNEEEEILRKNETQMEWETKAALQKSEKELEIQPDLAIWLANSWARVQRELEESVPGVVYYSDNNWMRERLI